MRALHTAVLSIVVAFGAACGPSASDAASATPSSAPVFSGPPVLSMASKGGLYAVAIRTSPEPPSRGEQSVEYTLTATATGEPAAGLTLAIVPWMPAMGHGTSVVPNVNEVSPGVYVATDVDWYMPGQWVLRTTIASAASDAGSAAGDYVEPSFEIP